MVKKKIGFLGGSFDPIHFGHLNLAQEALERLNLHEVWFCPTSISPFKTHAPPAAARERLEMTTLALKDQPKFKVLDHEIFLDRPAKTYETLQALSSMKEHADKEFVLILSQDLLPFLSQWFEVEKLLSHYELFVAARKCDHAAIDQDLSGDLREKIKKCFCAIRQLEISSQDLRDRLKKKLYSHHLCPSKVLDYIYEHRLY